MLRAPWSARLGFRALGFPARGLAASALLASTFVLFLGCQPKIGDDCITDIDCTAAQGNRICDTTQPNGYCTIADCDPKSCPDKESVCVSFNNVRSTVGLCQDPGQPSPYVRNFCMAACDSDKDCRGGYACVDVSVDNVWGAAIIERFPDSNRVCLLDRSHPEIEEDRADGFCSAVSDSGAGGASP